MMHDIYGQAVTTDSADVLAGIDAFMDGFLGNESTAGGILRIANDHPACVIANAYAASVMMLMESPRGHAKARQYLSHVEANVANTTPRERQVAAATAAGVNGEIMKAIELGEALAAEHPAELVSAKLCQTQHFNLGNAAGMLRVAERVADAHLDDAHLHGMLAFGSEQCHLMDTAERAARRALSASGIPIEHSQGAWGRGQQELNIRYAEVLEMADRHTLMKHAMKELADSMGLSITFMAKPTTDEAGSSSHLHLSLWNAETDSNVFDANGAESDTYRWFLGVWLCYVSDFMVCYAPTINSYKRYVEGTFAPTA